MLRKKQPAEPVGSIVICSLILSYFAQISNLKTEVTCVSKISIAFLSLHGIICIYHVRK
jgi:hypothetical protein